MNTPIILIRLAASALTLTLYVLMPSIAAADPDPGHRPGMMMQGAGSYGPSMMGGYGPGMMGGYGPGMMGGYGPGMMGMGHMMGGGYGMMGGYGHGMMGYGSISLSKEQRIKANQINDDMRKKHWELMGRMQDETSSLRNLYDAEKWDATEIGKAYQKIYDLKRQMIESSVEAHNRMEAILTKEQREQSRNAWPRRGMMWQEP